MTSIYHLEYDGKKPSERGELSPVLGLGEQKAEVPMPGSEGTPPRKLPLCTATETRAKSTLESSPEVSGVPPHSKTSWGTPKD